MHYSVLRRYYQVDAEDYTVLCKGDMSTQLQATTMYPLCYVEV
jgi:hypothetical protein